MFCRSEDFCFQFGVSNNIYGIVYINNSFIGVFIIGG